MKRACLSVLLFYLVAACFLAAAATGSGADGPSRLTLFFSADVRGNFEPCGCNTTPAGGIARRLGVTKAYQEKSRDYILQVDAGNYLLQPGFTSGAINKLMFESLAQLPVRVLNLASEDLYFWNQLRTIDPTTQVISTNLVPRRKSVQAPARYAVVRVPAGELGLERDLRIGFLGLTDPQRVKPNSGFRAIDPLLAVEQIKSEVLEKADLLIVLGDIPREEAEIEPRSRIRLLAEKHPEIAAIFLTEARYVLFPPQKINNAVILSGVERGRHLPRLTLLMEEDGRIVDFEFDAVELKAGVAEDPVWQEKQKAVARSLF